ncbi:hypothetical protein SUGI_1015880 [Cryptomeria japonica]|nr:hypothetical protein SUGI_1015880 [Cryptomeria japonica]
MGAGEEKRQEMMQNLFGESDEEVESDQEAVQQSAYLSDEEGEGEFEGEGQAEIEGEGEAEPESEGERADSEPDKEESEGERYRSSPEREISGQRMESEGKEAESDAEEYDRREATSRRQVVSASVSEGSGEHKGLEDGDEEVEQIRELSEQGDEHNVLRSTNMQEVFGDSDEEEPQEYAGQNSPEQSAGRAVSEEEGSVQRGIHPEDMIQDEEGQYESEEEQLFDQKIKEKPVGPPLDLEIPLLAPPGRPEKMNIVRVSNIMGIEPKPFDPKTFVEEEVFITDESGAKKRIRLEDNVVRWREVRNRNGSISAESNARFVRWSDGSMQLLIGNEVLDISVQDARRDNAHLFVRHGKGILQSQGRLQHKMRFMPSSLSSKSHKLLTALVDSRHKKSYKVKNVITNTDPEREKEEKEKALEQRIRSREDLHRKQEKITRKYAPVREREPQLSPGYLEEALEEDEVDGYAENRRVHARRFQEELEAEGRAERRIINAKKQPPSRERPPKYSRDRRPVRPSRREAEEAMSDESEREVSEYESEGLEDEEEPVQDDVEEQEAEEEEVEEQEEEEDEVQQDEEEEYEEDERGDKRRRRERDESPLEESPPRLSKLEFTGKYLGSA